MDEELKVGILEKNGQGDSSKIVNRNTQVQFADLLNLTFLRSYILRNLRIERYIYPKYSEH